MCRIIFLRHGEQPNFVEAGQNVLPNLKSEASEIGLTIQGSIRACFMPKLIKKILGKKGTYQLHTYTNCKHGIPVSRAYYTTQLLRESERCQGVILYDKSENMYELVSNILDQSRQVKNIVVCWEHTRIPQIIQQLLSLADEPNYKACVSNFQKQNYPVKYQQVSHTKFQSIQRCAANFQEDNGRTKDEVIIGEKELAYSPVWDVKLKNASEGGTYTVYPGFIINKIKKHKWALAWFL